jgi:hypothetical protein
MPIGTDGDGTDDNEGPHCRNCHTGANNCYTCHSDSDPNVIFGVGSNVSAAYTATTTAGVSNMSNYASQSFIRQSAISTTTIGEACLDGGFSFPHRTLGANMLKDELYGIDFDGSPVAAGVARTTNAAGGLAAGDGAGTEWEYWVAEDKNATSIVKAVRNDSGALEGQNAENMDSVCIDCHGDATYYQGDNPALYVNTPGTTTTPDAYGYGAKEGWELLLKGLP